MLGWSNIAATTARVKVNASRRRLSESSGAQVLQTSCTVDDDCEGFAVCMATTNFGFTSFHCAVPPKTCPNDCSGQGSCKFVKVGSTAAVSSIQVSECPANDYACEAVCECDATCTGPRAISNESLVLRQTMREEAIYILASIFNSSGVGECGWFDVCSGGSSRGLFHL